MPRPKHAYGSKTAFILGMPSASPEEIVEAAAKAGLKFSDKYVHTIRYNTGKKKKTAKVARNRRGPTRRPSGTGRTPKPGTKTAFVLKMPNAPAKDIVAAAKKAGMKLTERYVYVIRSSEKARSRRTGGIARLGRGGGGAEAELRQAIAELGLTRSRQLLAEMESAFR